MKDDLIKKAQAVKLTREPYKDRPGDVELAIALVHGEVSLTQAGKILGIGASNVRPWAFGKLKEAVSLGLLIRK